MVQRYAVTSCIFLLVASSSSRTIFLCASFGSFTSTFGNPVFGSRAIDLRVPSASVRMTSQSVLRISVPSIFEPSAIVTVTGLPAPPPPPRPPPPPPPPPNRPLCPATHAFWSALASGYLEPMLARSPATEWHLEHAAAKYVAPAIASPTRTFNSSPVGLRPGGLP